MSLIVASPDQSPETHLWIDDDNNLGLRVRTGRTQPVTRRVGSPFSQPTTDPFSISLTRKNSKLFFQSKNDKYLWISPIKSNSANISFLLDLIFMISSIYKRHIDIITLFLLSTTIIYSTLTHGSMTHGLGQPKQHSEGHWPNPTHLPISWPIRTLSLYSILFWDYYQISAILTRGYEKIFMKP